MGRTQLDYTPPPFVANQQSLVFDGGHQIDWDQVPDSYKDSTLGKKVVPAGTICSFNAGHLIPRKHAARTGLAIARVGDVATVTKASHGLRTGALVIIAGADQAAYNGTHEITVTSDDTFTFAVTGDPVTPATGTITSTITASVILQTNAVEGEKTAAKTGYGCLVGGVLNKNKLPEVAETDLETWITELKAAGTGYVFRTYSNSIAG